MKQYFEIADVKGRVIMDSNFESAVEVEVTLDDGTVGRASAPSGMAYGRNAEEAVENVNVEISEALLAMNALEQAAIDRVMMEIDGTENGERLGANAIMATSMACAKAAAASSGLSLFNYIGGVNAVSVPELMTEGDAVCLTDHATLTGFMTEAYRMHRSGKELIVSAGEGETEESIIADLAVALNAEGIVTAKATVYNQLIRIEEELSE